MRHEVELAIARSIQENRTVTMSASEEGFAYGRLCSVVGIEADDAAELSADAMEFWGEDDEGNAWRVEVRR